MQFFKKIKDSGRKKQSSYADVFQQASSWADDLYTSQVAKAQLFQLTSITLLLLCFIMGLIILFIVPLKTTELVVVHKSSDGVVWVDPPAAHHSAATSGQIESEIATYINHRESYSAFSFDTQYKLVNLMSSDEIAKHYRQSQDAGSSTSPIQQLGEEGTKTVQIESILFLDNESENANAKPSQKKHKNLAQVNFMTTTHQGSSFTQVPYTVMLSWTYRGVPDNPEAKWMNWDGFTITEYKLTQRSITH